MTKEKEKNENEVSSTKEWDIYDLTRVLNNLLQDRQNGAVFNETDKLWIRDSIQGLLGLLEE